MMINDAILARQLYSDPGSTLGRMITTAAARQSAQRVNDFTRDIEQSLAQDYHLLALADMGRGIAEEPLLHVLHRTTSPPVAGAVIKVLNSWEDPIPVSHVVRTLKRTDWAADGAAYLRVHCAKLLMRRGGEPIRETLTPILQEDYGACAGEAAVLLYGLDANAGLSQLECCLASTVPIVRADAAAALSIIGSDAAREILLRGLSEPNGRIDCCSALMEFGDAILWAQVRDMVRDWWPLRRPEGTFITMGEWGTYNTPSLVRDRREELREEYGQILVG